MSTQLLHQKYCMWSHHDYYGLHINHWFKTNTIRKRKFYQLCKFQFAIVYHKILPKFHCHCAGQYRSGVMSLSILKISLVDGFLNISLPQYVSFCFGLVWVSFIGGGNQSTQRKPPTCRKQLTICMYHIMLHRIQLTISGILTQNLVVICTDCTGSCKSNYHTITTMTAPHIQHRYHSINICQYMLNIKCC